MENKREENYVVGMVRRVRCLCVNGSMEFYVQEITYYSYYYFVFTANLLSFLSFEDGQF